MDSLLLFPPHPSGKVLGCDQLVSLDPLKWINTQSLELSFIVCCLILFDVVASPLSLSFMTPPQHLHSL